MILGNNDNNKLKKLCPVTNRQKIINIKIRFRFRRSKLFCVFFCRLLDGLLEDIYQSRL